MTCEWYFSAFLLCVYREYVDSTSLVNDLHEYSTVGRYSCVDATDFCILST